MKTFYTIDSENRIIDVGGSWNDFAVANDGAEAMADGVVGHLLWNFISGFEVVGFLNAVVFSVRRKDNVFQTIYRCDSPNVPRLFKMTAEPMPDNGVRISHVSLPFPMFEIKPGVVSLDRAKSANRCSLCCSFRIGEEWVDSFSLPEANFFPDAHVLCPACRKRAREGFSEISPKSRWKRFI